MKALLKSFSLLLNVQFIKKMKQQETFLSLKIEADVLNLCSPIFSFVASHLGHGLIFYVSAFVLLSAFKLTHFYTITLIFFCVPV